MSRRGGRGPWLVHGFRAPLPGPPDTAEAAQNPGFRGDAQDHFDFKYLSDLFKPRSGAEISQWPTRTAFSLLRRTARAPCRQALSCSPGAAGGARPRRAASRRPGARGAANSRREPDGVGRKLSTDRAPSSWLADVQKAWVLRAARTENRHPRAPSWGSLAASAVTQMEGALAPASASIWTRPLPACVSERTRHGVGETRCFPMTRLREAIWGRPTALTPLQGASRH